MNTHVIGDAAERHAVKYLIEKGYKIVKTNFRFGKSGEIDIIAYEEQVLVFIEVKCRQTTAYGSAVFAITPQKQKQIRKVAQGYLYVNTIQDVECRFDTIAINVAADSTITIDHLVNAFW